MRYGRVLFEGRAWWARLRADEVDLLPSPPYAADSAVDSQTETPIATVPRQSVRLLVPVEPSKILAVGRNFAEHAHQMGHEPSSELTAFVKLSSALIGPGDAVRLPSPTFTDEVEFEAELAFVIGKRCWQVQPEDALDHIFGYTCANDVSARDLMRIDTHVTRGKNIDTFCPLGPWIETEVDPLAIDITCVVNGEVRQQGNTRDHLFAIPEIVASLSQWTTLRPGDVVLTGGPPGRGRLCPGDHVEISIESVGTLNHTVEAAG